MESSEGLETEGSDKIKTTIAKNDLVRSLLGDGEKQETFDGHPRPDDGRDVLPTWRTLSIEARGPDQTNAVWQAIGHFSSTPVQRGVPSKTQSYDDTTDLKNQIYSCITKVAAVLAAGRPSERIMRKKIQEEAAASLPDFSYRAPLLSDFHLLRFLISSMVRCCPALSSDAPEWRHWYGTWSCSPQCTCCSSKLFGEVFVSVLEDRVGPCSPKAWSASRFLKPEIW